MFIHGVDITNVNPPKTIGRYESCMAIQIGDAPFYVCNVNSALDVDRSPFKIRFLSGNLVLIPDLTGSVRKSFAIKFIIPDGYRICSNNQNILVYRFAFDDRSMTIIGREYPELFDHIGFDVIYRNSDTDHYISHSLQFDKTLNDFTIVENMYDSFDDIPRDMIPVGTDGIRRFDKRMSIGLGKTFHLPVQLGPNTIVYVNPEYFNNDNSRSNLSLAEWCNKWYAGGLSDGASIILSTPKNLLHRFKDDMSTWVEETHNSRHVFIGYSYSVICNVRGMISRYQVQARNKEMLRERGTEGNSDS